MIRNSLKSTFPFFLVTFCFFTTFNFLSAQQTIAQVRLLPAGSVVTTTGIITTGAELGQIRYMQDSEAGIALYSASLSGLIAGDSIIVTGALSYYKGQLQLSPVISHQLIASGLPLPAPVTIDMSSTEAGKYESMRAVMSCLGISTCESEFDSEWFTIFDDSGSSARLVIPEEHILIGQNIPEDPISFEGIWTVGNDLFHLIGNSFSILPDTIPPLCQVIDKAFIRFEQVSPITLGWFVVGAGNFIFYYGEDSFDHIDYSLGHDQKLLYFFDSLAYGRIYQGKISFTKWGVTSFSLPVYFSPQTNTEPDIKVLFNRSLNTSFSDGSHAYAVGASVIESDIITRIENVSSTLDIAMYNTSRAPIVQAVNRAAQRGVRVRYLADDETSNSALTGILSFPVLFRTGDGLMHNKFIIGDAEIPDSAWLWTGSTNFSSNQLSSDPNNAFVIKDQAMAQNYLREFEEFWGDSLNHADGTSGISKTDNTAHIFKMGETIIESYFSPSDETNCHIVDAIRSADHHIEIGLLLLTKEDLVDELISLKQKGVHVRVIVEDEESSSLALSRLTQAGVETAIHELSPIFHHKYAIVDEGYAGSDPLVITGSHNWTFSADNINDENTLIVHNQSFANIFRQEFEARWSELTSTSTNTISTIREIPLQPNPAADFINIHNAIQQKCTITLFNVNGNIISEHHLTPGQQLQLPLDKDIPNGIYMIHWKWREENVISRFIIQR